MNRFANYDLIERHNENVEAAKVERDEWIRSKADQLAGFFPQCAMDFYPKSKGGFNPYQVGLDSDEAQDAYADFVDAVCLAKATKLRMEAEFMGEVA